MPPGRKDPPGMKGLELCRRYYAEFGAPMLAAQFPEVLPHIAVGLLGPGSECLGYDDSISQDHDFEPGFCIILPGEDIIDRRIYANYKLHDTNYIAHDMLHREKRYADRYTKEGVRAFKMRMAMADARFSEAGVDLKVARKVFLEIYANPVDTKIEE